MTWKDRSQKCGISQELFWGTWISNDKLSSRKVVAKVEWVAKVKTRTGSLEKINCSACGVRLQKPIYMYIHSEN